MNRFIKCTECHYNLSIDDNEIKCNAGSEIIIFPSNKNSGCISGVYTEEIFSDDDYD